MQRHRPWRLASVREVSGCEGEIWECGWTYPLVDEHGNNQDGDKEDNDEDDNDTGLTLGPVLALDELVKSVLAASS